MIMKGLSHFDCNRSQIPVPMKYVKGILLFPMDVKAVFPISRSKNFDAPNLGQLGFEKMTPE